MTFSPTWRGSTACREPRSSPRATTTDGGTAAPRFARCCDGRCWPSTGTPSRLTVWSSAERPGRRVVADHATAADRRAIDREIESSSNRPSSMPPPSEPLPRRRCTSSGTIPLSTPTHGRVPASSSSSGPRVTACVYGHLHSESEWSVAVQGTVRGVRYHCVAADAIGFRPLRVATYNDR